MPNAYRRSGWTVPTRYALLFQLDLKQWYCQEVGSSIVNDVIASQEKSKNALALQEKSKNALAFLQSEFTRLESRYKHDPTISNSQYASIVSGLDPLVLAYFKPDNADAKAKANADANANALKKETIHDHDVVNSQYYPVLVTRLFDDVLQSISKRDYDNMIDVVTCNVDECNICCETINSKTGIFWTCCNYFGSCLECSLKMSKCPICHERTDRQLLPLYLFS
jgi:hypothetical protein